MTERTDRELLEASRRDTWWTIIENADGSEQHVHRERQSLNGAKRGATVTLNHLHDEWLAGRRDSCPVAVRIHPRDPGDPNSPISRLWWRKQMGDKWRTSYVRAAAAMAEGGGQ